MVVPAHAPDAMTIARLRVWSGHLATLFDLHLEDDLMIAHVDVAGVPALNAALTSRLEILTRDGWVAISDRDRQHASAN
jgi:hypothetical protein